MLRLEKITGKNVWDILKLCVSEKQKNFVASNDISIIEAYTAITGNGYAFPFGIYEDDTPVGFLMIGFDTDDYWEDAPLIAKGNYNLCKNIQMLAIPGERDGVNAEYCVFPPGRGLLNNTSGISLLAIRDASSFSKSEPSNALFRLRSFGRNNST